MVLQFTSNHLLKDFTWASDLKMALGGLSKPQPTSSAAVPTLPDAPLGLAITFIRWQIGHSYTEKHSSFFPKGGPSGLRVQLQVPLN